ncbi:hypothetical protein K435DRAFT_856353 [Dendrothele bispora CBS 962.96]|uniref:Uncharacterized protein n=1 Tax=Dendrothele bispora (strain CBS 962.96) TaxID=1314807 RepID=A0A4V4HGG2_DENBC|nr:hypothetical protein K435DRAFT_856353 [Dendrothele bispora CBS 962.96]
MLLPHLKESWEPFSERLGFEFAINHTLDMWAALVLHYGGDTPWDSANQLYDTIDSIRKGNIGWKTYKLTYQGPLPPGTPPKWMRQEYELCVRDAREVIDEQLGTQEFDQEFDGKIHYTPYKQFENGKRRFSNLMSGDWAHKQVDVIAQDKNTHGSMLVPIVLGSDKMTVSVVTGSQEFHPAYMSIGNITNVARRAHDKGVMPFAFLPIPKTNRKQKKKVAYQHFCQQMYHACLSMALQPLKPGMTQLEYDVVKCPDGHFQRAMYEIGPYIGDYPEQTKGDDIIDDIDRRLSAVPTFPGIRCFEEGQDFKQWTGNNLKALMKIYLAAIKGYVPSDVNSHILMQYWRTFKSTGRSLFTSVIRLFGAPNGLCLSITESKHIKSVKETWRRASHTDPLSQMLSIITCLDQMTTLQQKFNQQGMLLGTVSWYIVQILKKETPTKQNSNGDSEDNEDNEDEDCGPVSGLKVLSSIKLCKTRKYGYPKYSEDISQKIRQLKLHECLRWFLYDYLYPTSPISSLDVPPEQLPHFSAQLRIFYSAIAQFYSPSDLYGVGRVCIVNAYAQILAGMNQEEAATIQSSSK